MDSGIVKRRIEQKARSGEIHALPDNAQWQNRFQVKSETTDSLYVVAQSKSGRFWSCGCRGFIRHKHCKHTTSMGLPGHYLPFEVGQLSHD